MLDILRLLMGANPGLLPQDPNGGPAPLPVPGVSPSPLNNQSVPPPPAAPQGEPDIVVGGNPIDKPKVHPLFGGGLFSTGRTGGNILGILGDAFRAQAGLDPMYAPKLQQARDAEALQNFQSDPTASLDKYLMTNPDKAVGAINTYQDNDRANRATTAVLRDKDLDYENAMRGRVGSMLYAANEKTFPQVLARAQAYADSKGLNIKLPQTWDEAQAWAREDVPVKDQIAGDALAAYRADTTADRRAANEARAAYYRSNVAERRGYHSGVLRNNDPNAKPPTPTTVLGNVQEKVRTQGYDKLTPGEKKLYDDSRTGKSSSKGNGIAYSVDPTTGKITFKK